MEVGGPGFGDLLHQAEQLTAEIDSGSDLPRVGRNLQEILEAGQRLLSKTAPINQDTTDVKASILLGSKDYDVPRIAQKLEGLSAAKTFEPLEPVRDTDIKGFLRNERENALLAVIEQTRKTTFEETERRHWESMENEWEREKQKILNALLGSGQDSLDFQQEPESILGDSISMQGRSALDNVEMAYARQVYVYNEQVIHGSIRPSLVDMFTESAKKLGDKNVIDLWEMVKSMTNVPVISTTSKQLMRTDAKMQQTFVANARTYLEQNYVKFITNTVYSNLQQAQLGGVPGTYNLVRSYLSIIHQGPSRGMEDGSIEGHPIWAMVYYCLRCGDLKATLQVVNKAPHQLGNFPSILQEYFHNDDHRLSPSSETKIRLHYRRVVRNSTDPYKRAVYCVVGQCDFNEDHSEIADKIDDYVWLKLCQIQSDSDDSSPDVLTLQKLQTLLYEDFGEGHFNGYQQPFLYFQVLILTAQFEAAIDFLSRIEKLRCHAAHVALVLYEMKLMLLPQSIQAQILTKDPTDPTPLRRLNFARLIMMYTRKFESTDPREALQYFYFLRDLRTAQGDNLFMSCVSQLVLETREFEMLLGRLEKDGSRKPGAIDKFHGETQKIIELVAKDTESKGLFEDAIRLYDLAKVHDKVLELLNKLLSQVVSQPASAQSSRERLKSLAISVAERYRSNGYEGTAANTSTFYLVLDLITFFDRYHEGNNDEALERRYVLSINHCCVATEMLKAPDSLLSKMVMRQLKLLPLSTDAVEHKVNSFRHYTDEVRRCLPDILLSTMNILHNQFKNTKNTALQSPVASRGLKTEDGGKETYLNYVRSQARALIMFAGMLPYRLPGDTSARLVQIEVMMN